jgi:hypothetical protein
MNDTITSSTDAPVASGVTPERLANLRTWNIGLTVLTPPRRC